MGENSQNWLFGHFFYQNLTILCQICPFQPISPKRYYKCSSFSPFKHIFWSFKRWWKKFGGKFSNLTFWAFLDQKLLKISNSSMFWPKYDWKTFEIIIFYMKYIELSTFFACSFFFDSPCDQIWSFSGIHVEQKLLKISISCTFWPKYFWKIFYVWFFCLKYG